MIRTKRFATVMLASALALGLSACNNSNYNRSLYTTAQPVVERTH